MWTSGTGPRPFSGTIYTGAGLFPTTVEETSALIGPNRPGPGSNIGRRFSRNHIVAGAGPIRAYGNGVGADLAENTKPRPVDPLNRPKHSFHMPQLVPPSVTLWLEYFPDPYSNRGWIELGPMRVAISADWSVNNQTAAGRSPKSAQPPIWVRI